MASKRLAIVVVAVVLILVVTFSLFFVLTSLQNNPGKPEAISVAYSPFESVTLFWVAQEQGFFSQNNLNVTVHKYDTGAGALGALVDGEVDVAVGTNEFPLVIRALNQASIRTFGSISKSDFIYLVGRVDRGINDVSDLWGKTIGTTFGTIAHYFLGRFLFLNDIDIENVTLVDLKTPQEWVDAVVNGSVDAVATAQPYANSAKEGLGANGVVWSIQSNQPLYTQAIATNQWITANPELVRRFLKALYQAEEFVINQPAEAKLILKKEMGFSDAYTETAWGQNQFSLSFDQSLIAAMENEARWLINNNLTSQTVVPNFLNYVYLEGLTSVKPEAVNIIR